jgi:isoleucyl-tRNA synthetase
MSSLYLDILKDRLYVSGADSKARRSAQSTLYELLRSLTLLMAPILSFTADEVWGFLPGEDKEESVHLAAFPEPLPGFPDEALLRKYEFLLKVRGEINRGLEEGRKEKTIATAQEARVLLTATNENLFSQLQSQAAEIQTLAQVAELSILSFSEFEGQKAFVSGLKGQEISDLYVTIEKAAADKCVRCWFSYPTVGQNAKHPQLCARCSQVLEG